MLSFKTRVGAVVGAVALATALATTLALPASAATAGTARPAHSTEIRSTIRPASATDCNPNPLTVVDECTGVTGTGLYVQDIFGQTFSNSFGDVDHVHIEIYGPHGHIKNCAEFNLGPLGVSPPCLWQNPTPHVHVTAGNYCSRAWQHVGSGYVDLSNECVNVHS
jgi:hypothetical protein